MRGKLVVFDGSTFFISDQAGDAPSSPDGPDGFFYADTRHLSHWELLVDGKPITPLTSRVVDYYSARIAGLLEPARFDEVREIVVRRDRIVSDGVHEDLVIENHGPGPVRLDVELRYATDFADLMEAKQGSVTRRRVEVRADSDAVCFDYVRDGFRRSTRIGVPGAAVVNAGGASWCVEIEPHDRWSVCIEVHVGVDGVECTPRAGHGDFGRMHPQMDVGLEEWLADSPQLKTDCRSLERTYRQSLLDIAALRFRPLPGADWSMPAAGLPWFMAVLGRDSVLAAYMLLPFQPEVAAGTLRALAALQAMEDDPFRDAEPGKIPHELRFGERTRQGELPYSPYYGGHDTTPLYLVLLDEYERWTGDRSLIDELESVARAAIAWIDGPGDPDGDGFLEYRTRSLAGMPNQCWKDSDDSIRFRDGRIAEAPIAACEVQGYAYDARRRVARLAREVWGDHGLADRLDADAAALRARFRDAFWCAGRDHPALALDRDKLRVDALTSNIGHLLWSGMLDDDQAAAVADHLVGGELFTGWGVRTMGNAEAAYNPIHYHNGTVWPHDTAIVAEGLRRAGFRDLATQVAMAVIDAAGGFEHQLPELFAGYDRAESLVPIEYPTASCPQAWSAAAPLLAIRTILGLDSDAGVPRSDPHLPDGIARLSVDLPGVGARFPRTGAG